MIVSAFLIIEPLYSSQWSKIPNGARVVGVRQNAPRTLENGAITIELRLDIAADLLQPQVVGVTVPSPDEGSIEASANMIKTTSDE